MIPKFNEFTRLYEFYMHEADNLMSNNWHDMACHLAGEAENSKERTRARKFCLANRVYASWLKKEEAQAVAEKRPVGFPSVID